eukprot:1151844-Pelagomonas_calceolata.AAC.1
MERITLTMTCAARNPQTHISLPLTSEYSQNQKYMYSPAWMPSLLIPDSLMLEHFENCTSWYFSPATA